MAFAVIMPRQGQSVESCIITAWNKKVGDSVKVGDVLFSYETDKSAFEEEATVEGTLLAVFHEEGDDVPCLENVCVIGEPGEDISAFTAASAAPAGDAPAAAPEKDEAPKAAEPAQTAPAAAVSSGSSEGAISPRARALAAKTGADISRAVATGPEGRIIERDIQKALDQGFLVGQAPVSAAAPAPAAAACVCANGPEYDEEALPNIRKVIAKAMHGSISSMAQLTMNSSFDATAILAYRAQVKACAEKMGLENITLNDIVLYAVSRVLLRYRDINANFVDDKMRYFRHANIGVAVDTERGLLVPTLMHADTLSLNEISAEAKALIAEAKSGSINPDKLTGGSFTVTNLGSLGVESFTPINNPPQTAILGVCSITRRIKTGADGKDESYPAMGLSLTVDHRVIDGSPAARFLKEVCDGLEHFDLLLAK